MNVRLRQLQDAVDFIREQAVPSPRVGLILGTGLGHLSATLETVCELDYRTVPHFPRVTSLDHAGRLLFGKIGATDVTLMNGRAHRYEGYSLSQVTLPIRVMRALGVELLIVSNASGGLNPRLAGGDIVIVEDHINLTWDNPLIGPDIEEFGPRFPDMSSPYDPWLVRQALDIARAQGFAAHCGVYAGMTGPNYETRAEYRMLRRLGADVVGMSTVPEVIVAVHAGLRVFAVSVVTNVCLPDQPSATTGQEVVKIAQTAEPKLRQIVEGLIHQYGSSPEVNAP